MAIVTHCHIDLSGKYDQRSVPTVLAITLPDARRRAIVIDAKVKRSLFKNRLDLKRVHALFIAELVRPLLPFPATTVICEDYPPLIDIIRYLDEFLIHDKGYDNTVLESIWDYRRRTGDPSFRSGADRFARQVARHSGKRRNDHRRHECLRDAEFLSFSRVKGLLERC